ncbi:MAG: sigma-70 family RNA polymerase sigma factor [Candidatus Synoicihabitans palmerolidicus]|nr:sigma-70 family RNA polymerase sigma factor [Candidatus Synoicihabitans palmerolidicus]
MALRAGLNHAEAEDVVQDVLQNVAQRIGDYETRDNRSAFRRWLMNQTRWRISDKFRQRDRAAIRALTPDDDSAEDPLNGIADENSIDEFWEMEWKKHVLDTAMERLAHRVPAKHFQAFELYARQGWPVRRIATDLSINCATGYLIAHRSHQATAPRGRASPRVSRLTAIRARGTAAGFDRTHPFRPLLPIPM